MHKRQEAIYKEGGDKFHDNPPVKKIDRGIIKPKKFSFLKIFFASHKSILSIAMIAVLIWNFGGQLLLEAELRFATYMGNRAGDFLNAEIKTSLPQEAEKVAVISSEQAQVEVDKNCTIQRNNNALQAAYQCLADGGTEYLCDFRRREMLKQACNSFVSNELDKSSQNPSQ